MTRARWLTRSVLALAAAATGACSDLPSAVEETTGAANVCNEAVPANRSVDGIPAYAQCAGFETGAIYSNNGVDTSATSLGADWVRTQGSGGYQCTELAHRYLHFRWGVTWLPRGNAGTWCDTQPTATSGVVQTTTPVHGDLIVFAPGACGADATTGHVAVIDVVDAARAQVTIVEQNRAGRRNANQSCATCYLHVVANDGSSGAGGATGAGGAAGAGAGGATGSAGATGAGGATGSAGATGAGGATGSGGTPGVDAGSTAGSGGVAGTSGGAPGAAPDEATGGCSLAAPGGRAAPGPWLIVAVALAVTARRRQR
jgi:hypothetical protein